MSTLHVVGLRNVGGLENLFAAYLGARAGAAEPPAVAVKGAVHPFFRSLLAGYPGVVRHQRRLGAVRLPGRGLRGVNRRRILAGVRPESVVFWSSFPDPSWVAACRRAGARIVYYDHGRSWQIAPEAAAPALAAVDAAITVSRAGRRVLVDRLGYAGPVSVVPNGVALPAAPPSPAPAAGLLRIGFAGRLVDKKGVPVLLHAAARLHRRGVDFRLRIVGDGPSAEALTAQVNTLGLEERVALVGMVNDVADFYRDLDVVVMPSLQEPFGLVAAEAAAHGVPAVAARVDGLAEVVRDGETGVLLTPTRSLSDYSALGGGRHEVPPRVYDPEQDALVEPRALDPDLLADCLARLAGDRGRLAALAAAARDDVARRFGLDAYARRLEAALAQAGPGGGEAAP